MALTEITDDAGKKHYPAGDSARILSLVPSLTELMFDMGLEDQLIGRTSFCIHPQPDVSAVASVGGTKRINMKKVAALSPTHALVNVDETPKQMAIDLAELGIDVVVTHPIEASDNRKLFDLFGKLFNRVQEAEVLTSHFDDALLQLDSIKPSRTALYLIWQNPWMTVSKNTYISRFLSLTGWQTVAHHPTIRYPEVRIDDRLLQKVDDVLFSSEPFSFTEAHVLDFQATFPDHANKARQIDAEMVSWYGSRAITGLTYLKSFFDEVRRE